MLRRGVIVDNKDPLGIARVRVRIPGIHDGNETANNPENFVWAEVVGSTEFGLVGGVGISSVLQNGTWVWIDNEGGDPNRPVVLGTVKGVVQSSGGVWGDASGEYPPKERKNFNGEGQENQSRFGRSDLHPLMDEDPQNTTVIETTGGHVIKFGKSDILISHCAGTNITIDESGKVNIIVVDDSNIEMKGKLECHAEDDILFSSDKKIIFKAESDIDLKSNGNFNAEAVRINLNE